MYNPTRNTWLSPTNETLTMQTHTALITELEGRMVEKHGFLKSSPLPAGSRFEYALFTPYANSRRAVYKVDLKSTLSTFYVRDPFIGMVRPSGVRTQEDEAESAHTLEVMREAIRTHFPNSIDPETDKVRFGGIDVEILEVNGETICDADMFLPKTPTSVVEVIVAVCVEKKV